MTQFNLNLNVQPLKWKHLSSIKIKKLSLSQLPTAPRFLFLYSETVSDVDSGLYDDKAYVAERLLTEAKPTPTHNISTAYINPHMSSVGPHSLINLLQTISKSAPMAKWGVILCVLAAFLMVGCESSSKFDELFKPSWAFDHFTYDGEAIDMKLDSNSGT